MAFTQNPFWQLRISLVSLLQMHAVFSCITFWHRYIILDSGLTKWDVEYYVLEKNNSYDWILQTQDCDFIAQHLQLDKRFWYVIYSDSILLNIVLYL